MFIIKLINDGFLDKYNVKLVAKKFNQVEGIDYIENVLLIFIN